MFYQTEALIRQLESMTVLENKSSDILQFLEQRLPAAYLERLITKKHNLPQWGLKEFRQVMPRLIEEDEEISQITKLSTPTPSQDDRLPDDPAGPNRSDIEGRPLHPVST